ELDLMNAFTKFSLDVRATTFYATKLDLYKSSTDGNTTSEHPFVLHEREKLVFKAWKEMVSLALPKFFLKWIGIEDSKANYFVEDYIRHILKERRGNPGKKHNDFVQLL